MNNIEENIQTLITMGFENRELNRKVLVRADNDISEAITLLTSSNCLTDEMVIENKRSPSVFIGPLPKDEIDQRKGVCHFVFNNQSIES